MRRSLLALSTGAVLALLAAGPSRAVVQGTESSDAYATLCEQAGNFSQAVTWRRTGIDLLTHLSIPMYAEMRLAADLSGDPDEKQAVAQGYETQVSRPLRQEQDALARDEAQSARQPGTPDAAVRAAADDFSLRWIVAYPDRYFRYGLYRQLKLDQEKLVAAGKAARAVDLEILARESCARQYHTVIISFLEQKEKQLRSTGRPEMARRYAMLARHYAHLAAEQTGEASWVRAHRAAVEDMLRGEAPLPGTEEALFAERMDALRLSNLTRPTSVETALSSLDAGHPQAGLEMVRYFSRNHSALGLLQATQSPAAEVNNAADTALMLAVARGDLAMLNGLNVVLNQLPRPEAAQRINRLLSAYSGLAAPATSDLATNPDAVARVQNFWNSWWQQGLQPGLDVTYFQDPGCHLTQTACGPTSDAGAGAMPAGANSGRWEAVVRAPQDRVDLLTASDDGSLRVWFDGLPMAITHDAVEKRLVARLLLPPGNHTLQMEYTAGRRRSGPDFRLLPLISEASPLVWLRHSRPNGSELAPTVAAALLGHDDPGAAFRATAPLLGLAGAIVLLLGTATVRRVRRRPAGAGVRARIA